MKVQVQFGGRAGKRYDLETNEDLVVVRTRDAVPLGDASLSSRARRAFDALEPMGLRFPDAGVEVFHVRSGSAGDRDLVRSALKDEPVIRFAGRVLSDPVFKQQAVRRGVPATPLKPRKEPVLYSENLFVKFDPARRAASAARKILESHKLRVKREIEYVPNAYFVAAPEGSGLKVFDMALELLHKDEGVELCHPEILRRREFRAAFPQQWHLRKAKVGNTTIDAHANVTAAWKWTRGAGIVIAVIDDGIDIDHEEFRSKGKIVAPRDATDGSMEPDNPRPRGYRENHGTACAGVACANGRKGASGVAPAARLMPIRLNSQLGSQGEADAFAWAADHGADVISCSWGPPDGEWSDPDDATHNSEVPLPDNTRMAIEYALSTGRKGKGCVICWAAGNGNESVDRDGYASHEGVIAVASCNDTGRRSIYSDTGNAIWCAFPSNDFAFAAMPALPSPHPGGGAWDRDHARPKTPGIWTIDRTGPDGYNRGGPATRSGDPKGNYCNSFGGTSSATPGVAGVAALVLAVAPSLTHQEVRDIIKGSCDRIDGANGSYGPTGHSPYYGYGRVNAAKAVALARKGRATGRKKKAARKSR